MVAAVVLIVLLVLVVTVVVAGGLRRLVRDESDAERLLASPGVHTVTYAVPNGVDPAHLRTVLLSAGFASRPSSSGSRECLVVACTEGDRVRLRQLIANVHESAYDGTDLDLRPVVFEDERHQLP
jgi:hypothetical protein